LSSFSFLVLFLFVYDCFVAFVNSDVPCLVFLIFLRLRGPTTK